MQIQSIEIEGFWAYRNKTRVDIGGLPLLVAIGNNGSGKSALLVSAVLAGLYGKFPTKTVEESITVGAKQGSVSVEFTLGDVAYKVKRTHSRTGAAAGAVHVYEGDRWKALTEKGVRETTAKVSELLGMSYETATMTWVAEQGQYGRFAASAPADRFKLLSGVFGLDVYAPKHKAALACLRKAEDEVVRVSGRITELNDSLVIADTQTLEGIAALTDDELRARADAASVAFDDASARITAHTMTDPAVAAQQAAAAFAHVRDVRLSQLETATASLNNARTSKAAAVSRCDADVAAAHARHSSATAALSTRTDSTRTQLTLTIANASQTLSTIDAAEGSLDALVSSQSAAESKRNTAETLVANTVELLAQTEAAKSALRDEFGKLRAANADTLARIATISTVEHDPSCFTCGQHLSPTLIAELVAAQQADIDRNNVRTAEINTEGTALAALTAELDAARHTHRAAVASAKVEYDQASERAASIRALLSSRDERTAALTAGKTSLAALDTDAAAEAETINAALTASVTEAETTRDTIIAEVTANGVAAAARVNELAAPTAEETALQHTAEVSQAAAEKAVAGHAETATQLEKLRTQARDETATVAAEIARRNEESARVSESNARIQSAHDAIAVAKEDVAVHSALVKAYAPGGIPAMILGGVIDELNEAVNVALKSLSNGELRVELRTGRDTADGGVDSKVTVYVETSTGLRAYETLSGGQRFRVDLAIRTGLAAAIARGTGTPIETFILDEGWGTLDESGIRSTFETLHRLSETINVLTVSHIEAVRENFPARVEVSIADGSSRATVVR